LLLLMLFIILVVHPLYLPQFPPLFPISEVRYLPPPFAHLQRLLAAGHPSGLFQD